MIFLGPLYNWVASIYSSRINHFPLIRLTFYSLDKTILYFLIFLVLRLLWRRLHGRRGQWGRELLLWVFVFYLMLVFALTVFRGTYYPWQLQFYWHRSLTEVNWQLWTQTAKLQQGQSIVDFIYNLFGNIAWFIPFGFLYPLVRQKPTGLIRTVLSGMLVSITIEALQFVLYTGISDVDDVMFNTLGALVGYILYRLFKLLVRRRQ
ncbi:VanZ family protein [Schleiferilactobacillus shenzhenensis]|uniref:VanZ family protein n=1 Tax=Schleiferilactobacillus shenzhenensis TaxID=1231337 RepID=UPI0003F589E1|nr:VanZ family protein [Schleiferilactobacillus shenzhenensis]